MYENSKMFNIEQGIRQPYDVCLNVFMNKCVKNAYVDFTAVLVQDINVGDANDAMFSEN